jgi:IS30 family transposase
MTLPYTHLSLAERREIARLHAAKIPIRVMAERLQRHRSTIYREIKRNWVHDEEPLYRGYYHVAADIQARSAAASGQTLPQTDARGLRHGPPQSWMVARADCGPPASIRCG